MSEQEITALAREYAEEISPVRQLDDHPVAKMIADIMRKALSEVTAEQIKNFEGFLRFLLRRYELVEKERLRRVMALHIEKSNEVAKGGETWFFHKGSANTLRYLFPDLGKEVEG